MDDAEAVTEEWLEQIGFRLGTMHATIIVDNKTGGAVIEMSLTPECEPSNEWVAALLQGKPDDLDAPDDHVLLTGRYYSNRGDVRRLCKALGINLK